MLRQYSVNHYSGNSADKPEKLPFGDFYFDEEVNRLYKYNESGVAVDITGATGESLSVQDAETLSHFTYNPVTDTLEADRSIETTLSSLYLGKTTRNSLCW